VNSRERVQTALEHQEPDHVPLDLGGSAVTGIHVSSVYALRQALGLDAPGTAVKVVEPYQMLGEVKTDLMEALEREDALWVQERGLEALDYLRWHTCARARRL